MQTIINKAMVYSGNGKTELIHLSNANFKGLGKVWVAVVNTRGSHPCAYVQFDGIHKMKDCEDLHLSDRAWDLYDIPGDINFLDTLDFVGLTGLWLGWDYCHSGQWYQGYPVDNDPCEHLHDDDHKYTTEEVYLEAYELLEALAYTALDLKV